MARLTVEDCLTQVDNRFELVLKAAKRARALEKGANAKVPWDHDKPSVVALREIAGGFIEEPQEKTTSVQMDAPVEEEKIQLLEVEDETFEGDLEEVGFSEVSEEEPEIIEEDIAGEDMAGEELSEEEPESEENP